MSGSAGLRRDTTGPETLGWHTGVVGQDRGLGEKRGPGPQRPHFHLTGTGHRLASPTQTGAHYGFSFRSFFFFKKKSIYLKQLPRQLASSVYPQPCPAGPESPGLASGAPHWSPGISRACLPRGVDSGEAWWACELPPPATCGQGTADQPTVPSSCLSVPSRPGTGPQHLAGQRGTVPGPPPPKPRPP